MQGATPNLPRSVRWRIQLGLYQPLEASSKPIDPTTTEAQLLEIVHETNLETIKQHNQRFQELMDKYIEEDIPEDEEQQDTHEDPPETKAPEIDPLTAMVMEQQAIETKKAELMLKYKTERAKRKRGLTAEGKHIGDESDGIDRASLVIIEKDLKRLPHPTSNNGAASGNLSQEEETRISHLKEVLYIYAQEHPTMGYRQGMHEIASYLMFVLELEQPKYPNNPLFDTILPICFVLLEKTLEKLTLAYDASGEEALQILSRSILGKIHQNDPALYTFLASSPNIPPPPIYCTRWVRLLFSREVFGYDNVFQLWDVFFDYYEDLMRALEVTSAARILLLREALLNPEHNPLDLLMNVPQLKDTTQLTDLLRKLMDQQDGDEPVVLPTPEKVGVKNLPFTQQIPPIPMPQNFLQRPAASHVDSPTKSGNNSGKNFSFSKMRQSIEKKGESLRKKIITATNEWKKEGSSGGSPQTNAGVDFFGSFNDPNRSNVYQPRQPNAAISDPLSEPFADPTGPMPEPPSPRKHQHAKWSELLSDRIYVIQQFLMSVEAKEQNGIPSEIWEAMADMQRMQQELFHYSRNMS